MVSRFESEDVFKLHSNTDKQVVYIGHRNKPLEERKARFLRECQEGFIEISFLSTGYCLPLFLCSNTIIGHCDGQHTVDTESLIVDPENNKVYINSRMILDGLHVCWKGWINLQTLEGMGRLELSGHGGQLLGQEIDPHTPPPTTSDSGTGNDPGGVFVTSISSRLSSNLSSSTFNNNSLTTSNKTKTTNSTADILSDITCKITTTTSIATFSLQHSPPSTKYSRPDDSSFETISNNMLVSNIDRRSTLSSSLASAQHRERSDTSSNTTYPFLSSLDDSSFNRSLSIETNQTTPFHRPYLEDVTFATSAADEIKPNTRSFSPVESARFSPFKEEVRDELDSSSSIGNSTIDHLQKSTKDDANLCENHIVTSSSFPSSAVAKPFLTRQKDSLQQENFSGSLHHPDESFFNQHHHYPLNTITTTNNNNINNFASPFNNCNDVVKNDFEGLINAFQEPSYFKHLQNFYTLYSQFYQDIVARSNEDSHHQQNGNMQSTSMYQQQLNDMLKLYVDKENLTSPNDNVTNNSLMDYVTSSS